MAGENTGGRNAAKRNKIVDGLGQAVQYARAEQFVRRALPKEKDEAVIQSVIAKVLKATDAAILRVRRVKAETIE